MQPPSSTCISWSLETFSFNPLRKVLRIRDVYPGSRIPDPGSQNSNKREGWKKCCCHLCSHQFHKIENYFSFEMLKKKIWATFQRIIELLTQKIVTKLSKIWVWDPGYEIRDPGSWKNLFRILDPGVKKTQDPRYESAALSSAMSTFYHPTFSDAQLQYAILLQ
jgi:hypothetical protein